MNIVQSRWIALGEAVQQLQTRWWARLLEASVIFLVLLGAAWLTQEVHRYVHVVFPLVLFFASLAFFRRSGALACTVTVIYLLHVINQKKMQATTDPLMAIDLVSYGQTADLTSYIDLRIAVAVGALVLALVASTVFQRARSRWWWRAAALLPLSFALLLQTGWAPVLEQPVKRLLRDKLALSYERWDAASTSVRTNSLLGHIWFTAETINVPGRGDAPIPFYQNNSTLPPIVDQSNVPLDVYLVLCEACWGPEHALQNTPIQHLLKQGFQARTAYSPEYGGNTANAEFEMLAGLPARKLGGVVYTNFGVVMRKDAATLPRELHSQGYETYAMHNYRAAFWKRNIVYPKFGFEHLIFLEQMGWNGQGWPDDALLFDAAWKQVARKAAANRFFFLLTVHTHGSYAEGKNHGYGDYTQRLDQTMRQLSAFVEKVRIHNRKEKRRALFVVFGDHKPSLLKWFYDEGVFDRSMFSQIGSGEDSFRFVTTFTPEQRRRLHSVPLLAWSDDPNFGLSEWLDSVDDKPFYCVSSGLASRLLRPASDFYAAAQHFCQSGQMQETLFTQKIFTRELFSAAVYADRLFK